MILTMSDVHNLDHLTNPFFSLYTMDCDASDHRVLKLDEIIKSKNPCRAKILGSCNGSLLIKADKNANCILWSPSINKFMKIIRLESN